MLLILEDDNKLRNLKNYDHDIRVKLSNNDMEPQVFDNVLRHIIHKPYRILGSQSPCINNKKCEKIFSKGIFNRNILRD